MCATQAFCLQRRNSARCDVEVKGKSKDQIKKDVQEHYRSKIVTGCEIKKLVSDVFSVLNKQWNLQCTDYKIPLSTNI